MRIFETSENRLALENNIVVQTPIAAFINRGQPVIAMASNIALFIMAIMLFLGLIVTNQLVDNAI